MKYPIRINKRVAVVCLTALAIVVVTGLLESSHSRGEATKANTAERVTESSSISDPSVDLSPSQLKSIKIEPVGNYQFPVEKETVGTISFADDLSVDVFPAYQGTLLKAFVELGTRVMKDQPLYTIKSPDLIQAESTLIGAAATYELTTKELVRAKESLHDETLVFPKRNWNRQFPINRRQMALSKPHGMPCACLARPTRRLIK